MNNTHYKSYDTGLVNDTFLMMHAKVGCTFQEKKNKKKKELRKAKAICNWTT